MTNGWDYITAFIHNSMWCDCQAVRVKKVAVSVAKKHGEIDVSNESFVQWAGDTPLDGEHQTKLAYINFLASQIFEKVRPHYDIPSLQIKVYPLENTEYSNYWLVFDANTSLLSNDEYDLLTILKQFEE